MKLKKTCKNCIFAIRIVVNSDILCLRKGAVTPNFVCGKHKMIAESDPVQYKKFKCMDCSHFIYKNAAPGKESSVGVCRLFSVRYFDGRKRSACSKYEHSRERVVS